MFIAGVTQSVEDWRGNLKGLGSNPRCDAFLHGSQEEVFDEPRLPLILRAGEMESGVSEKPF